MSRIRVKDFMAPSHITDYAPQKKTNQVLGVGQTSPESTFLLCFIAAHLTTFSQARPLYYSFRY